MTGIKLKLKDKLKAGLTAGLFLFAFTLTPFMTAQAQNVATSSCDPEYFKSMKSRAWLEAQREITQNQNLIFKPDSVLEYTCFPQQMVQLARNAPLMFSENPRWGLSIGDMAGALSSLVLTATGSYLTANFTLPNDSLLGGRADGLKPPLLPNPAQAYSCNVMNDVWLAAKCMDFIDNEEHDGFYSFVDYADASGDHRFLPSQCTGLSNRWRQELGKAYGEGALGQDSNGNNIPVSPGISWAKDIVNPYITELSAGHCSDSANVPLATGLTVRTANGDEFAEMVCIQPGCHYQYGGSSGSGSCVSSAPAP